MSCSLEEFEKLMAKQAECLAKQRLQERSEDLLKLSDMIKTNVRAEVHDAIQPVTKRQEEFEAATTKQFSDFARQMSEFHKAIGNTEPVQAKAPSNQYSMPGSLTRDPLPQPHQPPPRVSHPPPDLHDLIEKAERTVGLQPLYQDDVDEICRVHNITDQQHAMKLLVLEFLKLEMKNDITDLGNIVRVFPPDKPEWNTLYVEFDTRRTTRTVYGFTKFFRDRNHKAIMYIPQPFYDQFDHLSRIAYSYRVPPHNNKTRIHFGNTNMYLQVKPPHAHAWQVVPVHDLPPLTSQKQPHHLSVSPTLAPGRKAVAKTKRSASGSPESARVSKASKSTKDDDNPAEQDDVPPKPSTNQLVSHSNESFL